MYARYRGGGIGHVALEVKEDPSPELSEFNLEEGDNDEVRQMEAGEGQDKDKGEDNDEEDDDDDEEDEVEDEVEDEEEGEDEVEVEEDDSIEDDLPRRTLQLSELLSDKLGCSSL